jgi:sucrose phosphorylase
MERPVVRRILELIRLRASHPAFGGRLTVTTPERGSMHMAWTNGDAACTLEIDLETGQLALSD